MALAAKLSPCVIAMEACCGAHHLGRVLSAQGHTLRLMSPEYVWPYVKAQKNVDRDAEAIAEAATRPTIRFVTLKSEEQLDMLGFIYTVSRPIPCIMISWSSPRVCNSSSVWVVDEREKIVCVAALVHEPVALATASNRSA